MGKQRRKKSNNRKKGPNNLNKNNRGTSSHQNPNSDDSNTNSSTGSTSLINKIRHGDVRVRHGALSALSSSIFAPETLHKSRVIKMELIQAVAERIMDDDVPCSLCAVGCIANYILFQETTKNNEATQNMQEALFDANKVETILTPILLTKMNKACDEIKLIHEDMVKVVLNELNNKIKADNSQSKKKKKVSFQSSINMDQDVDMKKIKENECSSIISSQTLKKIQQRTRKIMDQYSLLSLSLHAFCGLVEIFTTNDASSSLLHHESEKFLSTTMRSLIISNEMILSITEATTIDITTMNDVNQKSATLVNKSIANSESKCDIISDVSVYAARTIHSSSDDNPEFIKKILSKKEFWDAISSSVSNGNLPTMSRLHMAGLIVASRQIAIDENKLSSFNIDEIITNQIFPLLSQCTMYSTDIAQALCQQVLLMESKLQKERDDEKLESNIIKIVDDKKESARLIARRQKEMKALAEANKDDAMEDVGTAARKKKKSEPADDDVDMNSKTVKDTEDKYDKAVTAWKNACLPLKMAVEVIANLCSGEQGGDEDDFYENMDEYWDSDNEHDVASSQHAIQKQNAETIEMFHKVTRHGIPDRVLSVFGCVILSLLGPQKDQLPKVALDDLLEILSKCSICLGNVVCNLDGWKSNDADLQVIWKEFFQCLRSSINGEVRIANMQLPCQAIAALFDAMMSFLRFRPSLIKCVDESDLRLILSFVSMDMSSKDISQQDSDSIIDIQKDAIGLLGLLCSEPHSDSINDNICTTFLTVLSKYHTLSAAVISELLNVLMDIYSADEGDANNHEIIFRKNKVLETFEKCIPILKRKIREESQANPTDASVWKEVALNSSRFVKYKKGC